MSVSPTTPYPIACCCFGILLQIDKNDFNLFAQLPRLSLLHGIKEAWCRELAPVLAKTLPLCKVRARHVAVCCMHEGVALFVHVTQCRSSCSRGESLPHLLCAAEQ